MIKKIKVFPVITSSLIISLCIYIFIIAVIPKLLYIGKSTDHKVYVAFGFHVNLYHSFRVDTNDESGFGKDIRIIRNTIKKLNELNAAGIPVKGVWDIENLFSLEEMLPRHAPDIIEGIKERVDKYGDEVHIMSYNNGLVSAMTEKEFNDCISRAISNEKGSGIKDIFGRYSPIVRPQEMMSTPGTFRLYKEQGIEAVSLYYSSVAFDSFRVFERELSLEEAHNPLTYHNKDTDETITVIPTYNIGDIIENVRLSLWIKKLRRAQLDKKINNDVLIYINFDADDTFWHGVDLPFFLSWLPNSGGIKQLVEEVSKFDYVKLTGVEEYLDSHEPVGEISFGQDTADGSFNGYNSWSEKVNSQITWTAVEKSRRIEKIIDKMYETMGRDIPDNVRDFLDNAYEYRIRLLSTTNYGMATPFLARGREQVVDKLVTKMSNMQNIAYTNTKRDFKHYIAGNKTIKDNKYTFYYINNTDKGTIFQFDLTIPEFINVKDHNFEIVSSNGDTYPLILKDYKNNGEVTKLYFILTDYIEDGIYSLNISKKKILAEESYTDSTLSNDIVNVIFSRNKTIDSVYLQNVEVLSANSLYPKVNYNDKWYTSSNLKLSIYNNTGISTALINGEIKLDDVYGSEPGFFRYTLSLVDNYPYLILDGNIKYPKTFQTDIMKPARPLLTRKYDKKWKETAPVELALAYGTGVSEPFKVIKRNYLPVESSYLIDYFKHSPVNLNLANVNNHITNEYAAVTDGEITTAVATDKTVNSNFAFMPLKIDYSDYEMRMYCSINPFGTYYGEQYYQPTWSNYLGSKATVQVGEQFASAGPTYNGYNQKLSLLIAFSKSGKLEDEIKADLISYGNPPYIIDFNTVNFSEEKIYTYDPPAGFIAASDNNEVYFHWEKPSYPVKHYNLYIGSEKGVYNQVYKVNNTTFKIDTFTDSENLKNHYYAAVRAVYLDKDGLVNESQFSIEDTFIPGKRVSLSPIPDTSLALQLKLLWSSFKSIFQ